MGYSNPISVSYNFAAHDFGAGSRAIKLAPPQGKTAGRVADIHVAATEVFTDTTTEAFVRVGDGTTDDRFAELPLGTLAAGASLGSTEKQNGDSFDLGPEDLTELEVNLVAPTGGTPSGIADVAITLEWF